MRKFKKLITTGLASVMAVSALGITAFAADNGVAYSYLNENGETVNVTEFQLAAEHWDTDFLENTPPAVYADFPMSVDSFTNDLGEQYLDLIYMKKLQDFTAVHVKLTDADNQEVIYDKDLAINSFYSPILEMGKRYVLVLTEDIGGATTTYQRYITTKTEGVELPEDFFTVEEAEENGDEDEAEENVILVASVDDIHSIQTVSDTGEIIIDSTQNVFDHVAASDFDDYCAALDNGTTYRVIANANNEHYTGFVDGGSADIYTPQIEVASADISNMVSIQSTPSVPSYSTLLSKATTIGFSDFTFSLTGSNYKAFRIDLSDALIANYKKQKIALTTKSDVSASIRYCVVVDDNGYGYPGSPIDMGTGNTIYVDLSNYDIYSTTETVSILGYVYFPTATKGFGMLYPSPVTYTDDVSGSINAVYAQSNTPTSLSNTQYALTDGNDMDIFYLKSTANIYQVNIRNRSISDQNSLMQGTLVSGSKEKLLTVYSAKYRSNTSAVVSNNVLITSEEAQYTVPKNADVSIYCEGSTSSIKSFVGVCLPDKHIETGDQYQISYSPLS